MCTTVSWKNRLGTGFDNIPVDLRQAATGLWYPVDDALAGVGASRDLEVLDISATGVDWYPKPGPDQRFDTGATIRVEPGEDAIFDAAASADAGDVIELRPGDYLATKTIVVDRPLTVRATPGAALIEFERTALFEIADGGSLKLSGVTISGAAAPDVAGNSAIRTSRYSMLNNYMLVVEDSTIEDLDTNHSFHFLRVARHTFADRIDIANSTFRNITGDIFSLDAEIDDLGLYNAEYVTVAGSRFENVQGALADVYRGGTDESTFGPHFELRDSELEAVGTGFAQQVRRIGSPPRRSGR